MSKASKTKPISDILKSALFFALNFIESTLTKRIENGLIDDAITRTTARLKEVTVVLNDENPDNKAQVLAIVRDFVRVDVTEVAYDILMEEIQDIKDEHVRAIATYVLDNAINIVNIFTDADADNATQLKNFLNFLRYDERTQDLIADDILDPLLESIGVRESFREFIIEMILLAMSGDSSRTAALEAKITQA